MSPQSDATLKGSSGGWWGLGCLSVCVFVFSVCACLRVCVWLCVCVSGNLHVYLICIFMCVCTFVCACVCVCLCVSVCIPVCVHRRVGQGAGWGPGQVEREDAAAGSIWESPRGPRQERDPRLDWVAV